MKHIFPIVFVFALMLASASCVHKELCERHEHLNYSRVRIDVDWTDFLPYERPTGMTVSMYPEDASKSSVTELTNDINYAVLNLPEGGYSLLVYNQSTSEFGSFRFMDMDDFSKSRVVGEELTSRWYKSSGDSETVIANPEWLGVESRTDLVVTSQMVELTNAALQMGSKAGESTIASARPKNVIATLNAIIHIKGIYNIRSVRASISGMASGYMLGAGCTTQEKATQLMEEWSLTADKSNPVNGTINSKITSFGLPQGHNDEPDENYLNVSILLVDGTTVLDYSFPVGNQFRYEMIGGAEIQLSLVLELSIDAPLPDVEPDGGGSGGFEAVVDDWGDEQEIDIGM